jgi:PAS domain S-box-containing protein
MRRQLPVVVYPDVDAALRAVARGDADAMVAGLIPAATSVRALGLDNLKVAGLVDARFDLCVAVRPDWPRARELLDRAIAADPPEVRMERFDRWLAPIMGLQRQAWRWRTLFLAGLALAAVLAAGILAVATWNRVLRHRVDAATAAIRGEMLARAESEARFRTMFEQAPIGMYRSTPGGQFLSVNPFLARIFEYDSPEQMIESVNRTGIAETLFEDVRARARIVDAVARAPGGLVVGQVAYRARSGRHLLALLSMTAIDDPVNGQRTLLGFVQDVTERAREEATRHQREKLLALGQLASWRR